jgi:hypothetical protein
MCALALFAGSHQLPASLQLRLVLPIGRAQGWERTRVKADHQESSKARQESASGNPVPQREANLQERRTSKDDRQEGQEATPLVTQIGPPFPGSGLEKQQIRLRSRLPALKQEYEPRQDVEEERKGRREPNAKGQTPACPQNGKTIA